MYDNQNNNSILKKNSHLEGHKSIRKQKREEQEKELG